MKWLRSLGVNRNEIVISTQRIEDYEEYHKLYNEEARIIYRKGDCIADNKNTLLEVLKGQRIIMISDAVKSICKLRPNGKAEPIASKAELMMILDRNYKITEQEQAVFWGTYPTCNGYFMDPTYVVSNLVMGCCMGFMPENTYKFRKVFRVKEDWDISLRAIEDGKRVVRFNDLAFDRRHKIKGGCYEAWHAAGGALNKDAYERLLKEHPSLCVPHATREYEIRYTGERQVKPIG